MAKTNDTRTNDLKVEMMLQINQKLWESGVISKEVYEAARFRIGSRHPEDDKLPGGKDGNPIAWEVTWWNQQGRGGLLLA